jgi:transcriptional regulator with XRE-family HTH domain
MLTGLELRQLRMSRGLTQRQTAEVLGVSRSSVASYERGWHSIPAGVAAAAAAIAALPARRDERLEAHNRGQGKRARQRTLVERVCRVCDRTFHGHYKRILCGEECYRQAAAHRRTGTQRRHGRSRMRTGTFRAATRSAEGRAFREARVAAGLTEADLGQRLGVSPDVVSRWERGRWNLSAAAREWLHRARGTP